MRGDVSDVDVSYTDMMCINKYNFIDFDFNITSQLTNLELEIPELQTA